MDINELQVKVNQGFLSEIESLRNDVNKLTESLEEMRQLLLEMNSQRTMFLPHIMSSYLTLMQSAHSEELAKQFKMINQQISESQGSQIINDVLGNTTEE